MKSYIVGTMIGAKDRYVVFVGMHTLLMGEYLRLPIYGEVSLILVSRLRCHLTKELCPAINYHGGTQPLKQHKKSPQ